MTPRTRRRPGGAPGRAGARKPGRQPTPVARHRVEFVFLPGLEDVVRDELDRALGSPRVVIVPGRDDAVQATVVGRSARCCGSGPSSRRSCRCGSTCRVPRALLDGAHFPRLIDAVRLAASVDPGARSRSFRFDAAGRDTSGLPEARGPARRRDRDAARPGGGDHADPGAPPPGRRRVGRPRAARRPAAVRPAVAHGGLRGRGQRHRRRGDGAAHPPRPDDAVANLMCGSGTLLIERLLAAPARLAVGVDLAAEAVDAAAVNVAEAGLTDRVQLVGRTSPTPAGRAAGRSTSCSPTRRGATRSGGTRTTRSCTTCCCAAGTRWPPPGALRGADPRDPHHGPLRGAGEGPLAPRVGAEGVQQGPPPADLRPAAGVERDHRRRATRVSSWRLCCSWRANTGS